MHGTPAGQGGTIMAIEKIRKSIETVAEELARHPDAAVSEDNTAVAVMKEGLCCRIQGPGGAELITDMPETIGGDGAALTPGWYLRAALASCDATVITMRAARLGIALTALEVTVNSSSDNRGLLGAGDDAHPGPLEVRVHVRIAANGASPEQLCEIVEWAERHSPVGDALRRAIPCSVEVDTGPG